MRMQHFVNEDKKIVTTVLSGTENDALRMLMKLNAGDGFDDYISVWAHCSYMSDKFVGIAKCHPDDDFDIQKGIELSKIRALNKYHNALQKELMNFANKMDQFTEKIDRKVEEIDDEFLCEPEFD